MEKPDQALLDKNLGYVQNLANKAEANVYLGMIPSAAEIWKDRLPVGADSWDQEVFLQELSALSIPVINFRETLSAHASEQIFYNTDHHWTTLGAFYGANVLLDALGKDVLKEEVDEFQKEGME